MISASDERVGKRPIQPFSRPVYNRISFVFIRGRAHKENFMKTRRRWRSGVLVIGLAACLAAAVGMKAQQRPATELAIGSADIGGTVASSNGPEAGVWVIAETADLPTKFAKIVVTDDQGRYVIPGLPNASYSVWVRGYGLVDSPKLQATPGAIVNLT